MRDAHVFLVTSEPMPDVQTVARSVKNSTMLKKGYAYKPGLFALIKLGVLAFESDNSLNLDTKALNSAMTYARQQCDKDNIDEKVVCDSIRALRAAIRNLKGQKKRSIH